MIEYVVASSVPNPTSPGTYTVTGMATEPRPDLPCTIRWNISGTIKLTLGTVAAPTGKTELHWEMTYQSTNNCPGGYPYGDDVTWIFDGEMKNNSCDRAEGNWYWQGMPQPGDPLTITKPSDSPDPVVGPMETSSLEGWWPEQPTIVQFKGTINATKSFAGRQVHEHRAGPPVDNCFDLVLANALGTEWDTGAAWHVGLPIFGSTSISSTYYWDLVGAATGVVEYYRERNRPPCGAGIGMDMYLYTQFISSSEYDSELYKENLLQWYLPDYVNVQATRDNLTVSRQWGIVEHSPALPAATQSILYAPVTLPAVLDALPPHTWDTVAPGVLPPGLTISSTVNGGVITGVPTALGVYNVKLKVMDSLGFSSYRTFTITVNPLPSLPRQTTSD